jgi:hypothetical protein
VGTLFDDTFQGTEGDPLTGHIPDVQNGSDVWAIFSSVQPLVYAESGAKAGTGSSPWINQYPMTGAPQDGTFTFTFSATNSAAQADIHVHRDTPGNNALTFTIDYTGQQITFVPIVATVSGTAVNFSCTLTTGVTYTLVFTLAGASMAVVLNGTTLTSSQTVPTGSGTVIMLIAVSTGFTFLSAAQASAGPTTATVTGPGTLTTGVASSNYTVTLNSAAPGGGVSFTPAATVFAAAFTPTTVTIASGQTTGTFTATSSTTGVGTVGGSGAGLTVTAQAVTSSAPSTPAVSPSTATVNELATQQLTASNFTGSTVTWSILSGLGTVNGSGLYTAPGAATTAVVKAVGVSNTSQTATATITVPAVGISISPTSATVALEGTQQFTPTVTGTTNTAVTWSDSGGGSVNSSGLYTAPDDAATATVTVTSVADATKSASATVTVDALATFSTAADFGSGETGLTGTVGFAVYAYGSSTALIARTISGIVEAVAGSGFYSATFAAPSGVDYIAAWDTGGSSPTRAFGAIAGSLVTATVLNASLASGVTTLAPSAESLYGTVVSATTISVTISAAEGTVFNIAADAYAGTTPRYLSFTSGANLGVPVTITASAVVSGNLVVGFAGSPGVVAATAGDTVRID